MKEILNEKCSIKKFSLDEKDISNLDKRTVVVTKWNWDYAQAHSFQRECLRIVQETPNLRVLICCNHPEVLTNGRGLQKPRKGEKLGLVDFKPQDHISLPYPLFQVERGGGLTFHHPGQFIFYPIVKLNPKSLSLSHMINQIFTFSTEILNNWGLKELSHEGQLLGLWSNNKKIASMGIAIEKLTTFHGMALNILGNANMKLALKNLNPCGIDAEVYSSVDDLITIPSRPMEQFREQFLQRIASEWK